MPRFYVVKGKPGHGVVRGIVGDQRQYWGMRLLPKDRRPDDWTDHSELYEPFVEVAPEKAIRNALKAGELEVIGDPISAPTLAKARAKMPKDTPRKPKALSRQLPESTPAPRGDA